jgi:hypothetical protein
MSCPYCHMPIEPGAAKSCPTCRTAHHEECWEENTGCSVPLCASGPVLPPLSPSGAQGASTPAPPAETSPTAVAPAPEPQLGDGDGQAGSPSERQQPLPTVTTATPVAIGTPIRDADDAPSSAPESVTPPDPSQPRRRISIDLGPPAPQERPTVRAVAPHAAERRRRTSNTSSNVALLLLAALLVAAIAFALMTLGGGQ